MNKITGNKISNLIYALQAKGIKFDVSVDKLRCILPHGITLSDIEKNTLKHNKKNIIQFLRHSTFKKTIETIYGLSPLQEGLLFHALYAPESDQYRTQIIFECASVNSNILKLAWIELVKRHAILRTKFLWQGLEKPVQIVQKEVDLPWYEEDWSNLNREEQEQNLLEYFKHDLDQSFDFSKPCLMRMHLIKLNSNKNARYVFVWTYHHILLDGWCLPIIFAELDELYLSIINGKKLSLPAVPAYEKYIEWLSGQSKDEAKVFWQGQLAGIDSPTDLGVNKNKLEIHKPIVDLKEYHECLSNDFSNECRFFAKKNSVTLGALVGLAWSIVLTKYSNQEDIVFGATVSGRFGDIPQIEKMVGLFINTLPLRVKISKDKTVRDELLDLHKKIQLINQYSYLSLNEVQTQSAIPKSIPIFYSLFVFENYPLDEELACLFGSNTGKEKIKLMFENIKFYEKTNYPLTLVILPGTKLFIKAIYDAESFSSEVIKSLVRHVHNALIWLIRNEDQLLAKANIFTTKELNHLIDHYNKPQKHYPNDKTIQQLFEEQVRKTPNNIALVYEGKELTYKE
ncbi:MAG: condensation domain-containing protein, partial [Gammaproteobacteria bacterium]|nr:condensation domain-containing protein [Gammaproteobacteria bacterium]